MIENNRLFFWLLETQFRVIQTIPSNKIMRPNVHGCGRLLGTRHSSAGRLVEANRERLSIVSGSGDVFTDRFSGTIRPKWKIVPHLPEYAHTNRGTICANNCTKAISQLRVHSFTHPPTFAPTFASGATAC